MRKGSGEMSMVTEMLPTVAVQMWLRATNIHSDVVVLSIQASTRAPSLSKCEKAPIQGKYPLQKELASGLGEF